MLDDAVAAEEPFTIQMGDVWLVDVKAKGEGGRHDKSAREEYWVVVKGLKDQQTLVCQEPNNM